ncbi:hypothetical protein ABZ621_36680 [Streptomyces sp. NPDC007863]|uniref:hypothetical protein n=1 Tax=Streptomyces sp. NPDC007863 TaxID=3154894 RepID=UPI0033CF72FA
MTTVYVATQGDTPLHSADTLQAAQDTALARHTEYLPAENYDFRWDEYMPGQVWRLMSRHKDRKGRHSWTGRAIHAVEHVPA